MPTKNVDLTGLFQAVTRSLQENQQNLDRADSYNKDHGTNMVQTFQTISDALKQKKGSSASTALAYAGKMVAKTANSSSGKLYAENLSHAAAQFKGKKVNEKGALELLQTLIGGGQGGQSAGSQSSGADMLGSLLGGMTGGQSSAQAAPSGGGDMLGALLGGLTGGQSSEQSTPSGGGDMLGALLGGLTGGQAGGSAQQGGGLDLQDLLAAGMSFMQAKQQGQGNLMALVQAFTSGSGMGSSEHRNQSTQIVVQSFLQALGGKGK